jgi:hypothetical protein
MGARPVVVALVLLLLSSTLSGCLALVPAREFLEWQRDDVQLVTVYHREDLSHTFTELAEAYTNQTSFYVDDSVSQIDVYFKASFSFSDEVGCADAGVTRFVRATLLMPDNTAAWETEVCENANPPEEHLLPQPEFQRGEWVLSVEARGVGEEFLNQFKDNFNVVVTVHRECVQYPLDDACE